MEAKILVKIKMSLNLFVYKNEVLHFNWIFNFYFSFDVKIISKYILYIIHSLQGLRLFPFIFVYIKYL